MFIQIFTIFTEIEQKTGDIKKVRLVISDACTQGIRNLKLKTLGTPPHFRSLKKPKAP